MTIGVEKDYASGVATVAALIDTLVALINGKAGLTDSVTAEDSVTYIKLVSNFSQVSLGDERWTMIMVVAGGAGTLDSAAHVSLPTVAMVCDSMVAAINASDSGAYFTAADATTNYTVTSDKKGLTFHIAPTDTVQDDDSATTQENVMSWSSDSATVKVCKTAGFLHVDGFFILEPPSPGQHGGLDSADSAILTLYTTKALGRKAIARDTCASPPCTLDFIIPYVNIAGSDSVLYHDLEIHLWVSDSTSDTTQTVEFPLRYEIYLK